ncbi:MAG: isochorismatase family protein [Deltaproteobacteria bacterium]|nr:isochorismatase family protein [Deltaproteobacteria bacterium]MBW2307370.1 isochorismatase family protein [Deltaproteobacteria bacterium]
MHNQKHRIVRPGTVLAVVDIQESLFGVLKKEVSGKLLRNVTILIKLARKLDIPILLTEQYPKGLKQTILPLKEVLGDLTPIEKTTFSCCDAPGFEKRLDELKAGSVILTGIETHVCILQTALDLLKLQYRVFVPCDAVASRWKLNWETGLRIMSESGAAVTSTEVLVFQLLQRADTEEFKHMAPALR